MKLKVKGVKESLGLAGLGIGLAVAGEAFKSDGLSKAGTTATSFIPLAVNIGAGATVINMAKDLRRIKKK